MNTLNFAVNPNTVNWSDEEMVEMSAYEDEREEGNTYDI